jgi:hypothetical protein
MGLFFSLNGVIAPSHLATKYCTILSYLLFSNKKNKNYIDVPLLLGIKTSFINNLAFL